MRHIDIKHHFIRDALNEIKVRVTYVKAEDQHADVLTKPLDRRMFQKHVNALINVGIAFGEGFVSSLEVGEGK